MKSKILILIFAAVGLSRAGLYIDINSNSTYFIGTVEPVVKDEPELILHYNLILGFDVPLQPGFGFSFAMAPNIFDVGMDDGNTYSYSCLASGPVIALGFERKPFYIFAFPSLLFFNPNRSGEFLQTDFSADVNKSVGFSTPVSAGLKFGWFYVGGFFNYFSWSSPGDFTKKEWRILGWHVVATGHEQCTIDGPGLGFTLGMRFQL